MGELTHLRLDKQLKRDILELVNKGVYATQSEFIKEAIRNQLNDIHKRQAIRNLALLQGRGTPKKSSRKERARAVNDGLASKNDIFKDLGLE